MVCEVEKSEILERALESSEIIDKALGFSLELKSPELVEFCCEKANLNMLDLHVSEQSLLSILKTENVQLIV